MGGSAGDPADGNLEMKGIQLRGAPMYLDMQVLDAANPVCPGPGSMRQMLLVHASCPSGCGQVQP